MGLRARWLNPSQVFAGHLPITSAKEGVERGVRVRPCLLSDLPPFSKSASGPLFFGSGITSRVFLVLPDHFHHKSGLRAAFVIPRYDRAFDSLMKTVLEPSHEVHAFVQDGEDDGWPPGLRHAEDEMFSAGSHAQAGEQKTHVLADPDT